MAADLSIVVDEGLEEADFEAFFASTIGSDYGPADLSDVLLRPMRSKAAYDRASERMAAAPQVWIGEVSWLKAALLADGEEYVPGPVMRVSELLGDSRYRPVLTEALLEQVLGALDLPNTTGYSVARREAVEPFLREHMGKRVFGISW